MTTCLLPLGKAFFNFNMQFDFDPEIKGDLEVKAQGTESLMANEVRSQRLMQFLGVVSNPMLAPFARMDYIVREIAKSMDLDPDKVANSMSDAAIQAETLSSSRLRTHNPSSSPRRALQREYRFRIPRVVAVVTSALARLLRLEKRASLVTLVG
jgi:hypothetical protein